MDKQPAFTKLDQPLNAAPIVVGQRRIQPMVRVAGWQTAASDGSFAGALGRVTPQAILVQEGDQEYTIPVTDPQREIVRGLLTGALAVSALCLLIMVVAGRAASRRRTGS